MEGTSLDYCPSTKTNSNNAYLNKTIEQRSSQDNVDYPSIASSIVTGLLFNAYLNKRIEQRFALFLYGNGYNFNNTKVMLDDLVFTAHYLQTWIQHYVLQFLPFTS